MAEPDVRKGMPPVKLARLRVLARHRKHSGREPARVEGHAIDLDAAGVLAEAEQLHDEEHVRRVQHDVRRYARHICKRWRDHQQRSAALGARDVT